MRRSARKSSGSGGGVKNLMALRDIRNELIDMLNTDEMKDVFEDIDPQETRKDYILSLALQAAHASEQEKLVILKGLEDALVECLDDESESGSIGDMAMTSVREVVKLQEKFEEDQKMDKMEKDPVQFELEACKLLLDEKQQQLESLEAEVLSLRLLIKVQEELNEAQSMRIADLEAQVQKSSHDCEEYEEEEDDDRKLTVNGDQAEDPAEGLEDERENDYENDEFEKDTEENVARERGIFDREVRSYPPCGGCRSW
jgi:hypothetical protein